MSEIDRTAKDTIRKQRIAELIGELQDLDYNTDGGGEHQPTLYEEGAKVVVEKMHNPKTMHDRQIHTNMPKSILTNVMMMDAIEEGLRKIFSGERLEYNSITKNVSIYRKMPNGDEYVYKTMTFPAFRRAMFYADAMQGFSGNLLELLMSHEGWRSEQGEREISSLVNSENMRNQNKSEIGLLRRAIKKVI